LFVCGSFVIEKYEMEDVFLNDEHSHLAFNSHDQWDSVGEGDVSFLPLNENPENEVDVLAVQMDINSSLSILKTTLGHQLGTDISHCEIWLQDMIQLNEDSTLSEQCVQGEGSVQVNLEFKTIEERDRINIIDVLKPMEEVVENEVPAPANETDADLKLFTVADNQQFQDTNIKDFHVDDSSTNIIFNDSTAFKHTYPNSNSTKTDRKLHVPSTSMTKNLPTIVRGVQLKDKPQTTSNENITKWVMDSNFRKEQERLKMPLDPSLWTKSHVEHWITWSINQFHLKDVSPSQWSWIDGTALCAMTHSEFTKMVPSDPNDLFWTHLELLRKCKFVCVIQRPIPYLQYVTTPLSLKGEVKTNSRSVKNTPTKSVPTDLSLSVSSGNRTGSNGQVQLWQFLLELLTDRSSRDAISWIGTEGEFKLNNPEMVAQLWGERKNKPHMNYEKLSRALRYYYDGDMISKVHGKRFVYKFVCDLKQLLGFSADELNKLVMECESKHRTDLAYL